MKNYIMPLMVVVLSSAFMVADASPKDDVNNAAMALANETNYSWEATVEVPEDSQFKPVRPTVKRRKMATRACLLVSVTTRPRL